MVDVAEDGRGVDLCVKLVGEKALVLGVQVRKVLDSKNAFSVLHPPVTLTGPEIESNDDESEAQQAGISYEGFQKEYLTQAPPYQLFPMYCGTMLRMSTLFWRSMLHPLLRSMQWP